MPYSNENIQPAHIHKVANQQLSISELWQQQPMQVLILLFDKASLHISYARSSLTDWGQGRYQSHVLNAVTVIEQLQLTLNTKEQNAVAENLNDIYRYIVQILVESITDQQSAKLTQASQLLMQIRESLSAFVKKTPQMLQH